MVGAVIVDRQKKSFINVAGSHRFTYVKNILKAQIYDEWTARNIVSSNLPKEVRKNAEVIIVEQDEKTEAILAVHDPLGRVKLAKTNSDKKHVGNGQRQQIKLHGYGGDDCEALMQGTLDKLSEILSEVDREISDIYHFLIEHNRLPANKAIQVFYLWYEVLLRRSDIKKYMAALNKGLDPQTYKYSPRTDLYDKLEEMVGGEYRQSTS